MKIPAGVNITLLVAASCAFYTYIGQLVPQKELLPPAEVLISKDISTAEMVKIGHEIAQGQNALARK